MAVNDQSRLGCGRLIDELWDTADQPPNEHELSCPFCQQARTNLQALSDATDALTAHEDESPDFTPSMRVKDLVMQLVHVEVRRGQAIPLLTPELVDAAPELSISEQAVLDVVWRTADAIPGLVARHCAVRLHPLDQQPGLPAVVHIDLHIAVASYVSIPQITDVVRAQLSERIAAETGLSTRRVSITVEDLFDA
jgi:hypothetical protein